MLLCIGVPVNYLLAAVMMMGLVEPIAKPPILLVGGLVK